MSIECFANMERLAALACGRVPELDGVVVGSRCERAAVAREGYGLDAVSTPFERLAALACGRVPELDGVVVGSRCERAAVAREGYGLDAVSMPFERLAALTPILVLARLNYDPFWDVRYRVDDAVFRRKHDCRTVKLKWCNADI